MNNDIIKTRINIEEKEDLTKLFKLEDTKVYEYKKVSRINYNYEEDEIINSKLIKRNTPKSRNYFIYITYLLFIFPYYTSIMSFVLKISISLSIL